MTENQQNKSERSSSQQGQSPRRASGSPKRSANKIYKTPPTPPPKVLLSKEKNFVLDSIASSSISIDYSKTNPKLGPVIPPYNSQRDKHCNAYFKFFGVDDTLDKTRQRKPEDTSIEGKTMDEFARTGPGSHYLFRRNQFGMGHSRETIDGHGQFMQGVKPVIGFNGNYGFRRNTPWLRKEPSPFGTASRSPCH